MPTTEPGYSLAVIGVKDLGRRAAAALAEQYVDIPVSQGRRRWGRGGGPQGSIPEQNSTAANVEQIVDIPARRGSSRFSPGQGSSSSRFLHDAAEGIQGGFRTFPGPRKVRRSPGSRVRECPPMSAHPN